nr:MAG TPA: hypothetical protein [Caudoviricetes sp.]
MHSRVSGVFVVYGRYRDERQDTDSAGPATTDSVKFI